MAGLGPGAGASGVRGEGRGGAVGPPGRRRGRRVARSARRAVDRHGVGQVAGLPGAGAVAGAGVPWRAGAARRVGALPLADQGARPGPALLAARPRHRGPARHARRRQQPRAARVDPRPWRVRPHQPRHAPPQPAARPRALDRLLAVVVAGGRRRVPSLPRGLRCARRPRAAPAAARLRVVRRRADVRAGLRHGGRPGRGRAPAHRSRRARGGGGRLAARPGHRGAVGAAADRAPR